MDRIKIKEWAKEKIINNKLNIWKGILLVEFILLSCTSYSYFINKNNFIGMLIGFILEMFLLPFEIGLIEYLINIVKYDKYDLSVIFDHYSQIWKIIGTLLLVGIFTMAGFILFIIPGIYLILSYSLVPYLLVVRKDLDIYDTLQLSRNMMEGHKLQLVVLSLSFIGWFLLTPFTLGILLIWLVPYVAVSITKFYIQIIENYEG